MTRYWQLVAERFNGFSKRERAILLLAVLAVIYLVWALFFLNPVSDRIASLTGQQLTAEKRLAELQAQAQVFGQTAGQDPFAGKKRQIDQLRERLTALDQELQTLQVGLVPVDMLPQVLHDVLARTGSVELLGMQTLPVERLAITESDEQPEAGETAERAPQQVDVYRHAVEVQVRGGYFAVADYLRALEQLPWRFYWDRLDYQVDRYPQAVATLEVYTLSAGEGPLGE